MLTLTSHGSSLTSAAHLTLTLTRRNPIAAAQTCHLAIGETLHHRITCLVLRLKLQEPPLVLLLQLQARRVAGADTYLPTLDCAACPPPPQHPPIAR